MPTLKMKPKKCEWMNPPCKQDATIFIPGPSMYCCDDHYYLNILRFGCDLKGVPVEDMNDTD